MQKNRLLYRGFAFAAVFVAAVSCSSDNHSGTAPGLKPTAPAQVVATPLFAQNTVSWLAVSGNDSNNIYWSTTAGVVPHAAGVNTITNANNPSVLTGLTNGTTYYYVVTAFNANGEGPASTEVSATPLATLTAAPPTGVIAAPGPMVDTIHWKASAGATSYNLYWANAAGIDPTMPATYAYSIHNATAPYLHQVITNTHAYFYVVTSVNANGESGPSAEVSATPLSAPAIPTGVSASPGNASDTVKWTKVAGNTYTVYRGTSPGVTSTNATYQKSGVLPPFSDTATNTKKYYYVVAADNGGVESGISAEVNATPNAPPAPPTAVAATVANASSSVSWTAAAGATGYNVYYSTTTGFGLHDLSTLKVSVAASPAAIPGLTNGTTYYYVVSHRPYRSRRHRTCCRLPQARRRPSRRIRRTQSGGTTSRPRRRTTSTSPPLQA